MCGIVGKLHWQPSLDNNPIHKMSEHLKHRGPDEIGSLNLENISLGFRRLSILDLSDKANQPMSTKDNRFHLVFNGEIYNYKDLKKELINKNYKFHSKSDTEVVLSSFVEWGPKCLNYFNGMFALAIWDAKYQKLFLARDRFGQKPLYYHINNNKEFIFASELSALMVDDSISKNISLEALNCYLAIGYILSPMTFYEDIYKLEPGTYLFVSKNGNKIIKNKYWNYAFSFRSKTKEKESDIAEHLVDLLEKSIKRRLVSDVPVGALLSGGIDSASIVSIMKRYYTEDLHTFSVGFHEKSYNEIPDAEKVSKWFETIHHSYLSDLGGELDPTNIAIDSFDEPFSDTSLIPTFEVSKLASQYVKVALSGDGADELFAGYQTYKADKYYTFFKYFPNMIKIALSELGRTFSQNQKKLNLGYKLQQFFYGSMFNRQEAHFLWRIYFQPEERVAILGEENRDLVYDSDPIHIFNKHFNDVEDLSFLDKSLYVDCMTWLADDILVKVDRASMRNSLEIRCPFLDVDLATYAASIPVDLKMKGLETKYIFKKALKSSLPKFVLSKKKSGFNAPIGTRIQKKGLDEFRSFNKYVFDRKVNL